MAIIKTKKAINFSKPKELKIRDRKGSNLGLQHVLKDMITQKKNRPTLTFAKSDIMLARLRKGNQEIGQNTSDDIFEVEDKKPLFEKPQKVVNA